MSDSFSKHNHINVNFNRCARLQMLNTCYYKLSPKSPNYFLILWCTVSSVLDYHNISKIARNRRKIDIKLFSTVNFSIIYLAINSFKINWFYSFVFHLFFHLMHPLGWFFKIMHQGFLISIWKYVYIHSNCYRLSSVVTESMKYVFHGFFSKFS